MATTAPTYDPKTTATQLATAYIQDRQKMLTNQNNIATQTGKALSTLSSAMSDFQSVLSSLSSKKTVLASSATFSSTVGTASATAAATPGNYFFYVEQLATANQAQYGNIADTTPMSEAGTITVSVGGTSIPVDLTKADKSGDGILSVKELAAAINGATGNTSKVTASTMTVNGVTKLVLTANATGAANTVSIDASALPAGALQTALSDPANRKDLVTAQDAIVYLGDKASGTKLQQASNTYNVIDGVTMTFTKAQAAGENPVSLTVGTDNGATASNVQAFVDGWNKLVKNLQGLMDAGDAAKGEAAGLFHADAGLQALQARMQAVLRQQVGGVSLVNYGITAQRNGTLSLNTERLTKALAAKPDGLDALMGNNSISAPTGVVGGLDKLLRGWTSSTDGQITKRRDANTHLQTQLVSRQTNLDAQYEAAYNRYLAQFTQLQTLQSQMSSNTSIFDALFAKSNN